jgi:hypothetical protein
MNSVVTHSPRDKTSVDIVTSRLSHKWHPIPYIVHYSWGHRHGSPLSLKWTGCTDPFVDFQNNKDSPHSLALTSLFKPTVIGLKFRHVTPLYTSLEKNLGAKCATAAVIL